MKDFLIRKDDPRINIVDGILPKYHSRDMALSELDKSSTTLSPRVREILDTIASQGHSGSSIQFIWEFIRRMMNDPAGANQLLIAQGPDSAMATDMVVVRNLMNNYHLPNIESVPLRNLVTGILTGKQVLQIDLESPWMEVGLGILQSMVSSNVFLNSYDDDHYYASDIDLLTFINGTDSWSSGSIRTAIKLPYNPMLAGSGDGYDLLVDVSGLSEGDRHIPEVQLAEVKKVIAKCPVHSVNTYAFIQEYITENVTTPITVEDCLINKDGIQIVPLEIARRLRRRVDKLPEHLHSILPTCNSIRNFIMRMGYTGKALTGIRNYLKTTFLDKAAGHEYIDSQRSGDVDQDKYHSDLLSIAAHLYDNTLQIDSLSPVDKNNVLMFLLDLDPEIIDEDSLWFADGDGNLSSVWDDDFKLLSFNDDNYICIRHNGYIDNSGNECDHVLYPVYKLPFSASWPVTFTRHSVTSPDGPSIESDLTELQVMINRADLNQQITAVAVEKYPNAPLYYVDFNNMVVTNEGDDIYGPNVTSSSSYVLTTTDPYHRMVNLANTYSKELLELLTTYNYRHSDQRIVNVILHTEGEGTVELITEDNLVVYVCPFNSDSSQIVDPLLYNLHVRVWESMDTMLLDIATDAVTAIYSNGKADVNYYIEHTFYLNKSGLETFIPTGLADDADETNSLYPFKLGGIAMTGNGKVYSATQYTSNLGDRLSREPILDIVTAFNEE